MGGLRRRGTRLAGAVTGVFMAATVITQLGVPALLRAVGHRAALIVAAVALGAPAALLVLTPSPWLAMPGPWSAGRVSGS